MSKVKLRQTHFDQLISYAESAEREGWYYGNEDQFQKRHKEILEFLNEQLKSLDKPNTRKNMIYQCPNCDSTNLLVYEETAFDLNTGDFYCHSVKAHDSDATVCCQDCEWEGKRKQLETE